MKFLRSIWEWLFPNLKLRRLKHESLGKNLNSVSVPEEEISSLRNYLGRRLLGLYEKKLSDYGKNAEEKKRLTFDLMVVWLEQNSPGIVQSPIEDEVMRLSGIIDNLFANFDRLKTEEIQKVKDSLRDDVDEWNRLLR